MSSSALYTPLNKGRSEHRPLIAIGGSDAVVKCKLIVALLNGKVPFLCVSYLF
jgi:hypothetical protein